MLLLLFIKSQRLALKTASPDQQRLSQPCMKLAAEDANCQEVKSTGQECMLPWVACLMQ